MQKQRTKWHYLAMLAVLASCGLSVFAGGGGDQKDAPKPLPPEIVKAWRDAGAEVGWMKTDSNFGVLQFGQEKGEAGAIPAFRFSAWRRGAGEAARSWERRSGWTFRHAGDGRGAEGAGRAEELAIAEP